MLKFCYLIYQLAISLTCWHHGNKCKKLVQVVNYDSFVEWNCIRSRHNPYVKYIIQEWIHQQHLEYNVFLPPKQHSTGSQIYSKSPACLVIVKINCIRIPQLISTYRKSLFLIATTTFYLIILWDSHNNNIINIHILKA